MNRHFTPAIIIVSRLLWPGQAGAQEPRDTMILEEARVRSFEKNEPAHLSSARSFQVNDADRLNRTSLVAAFNQIAGVRMEERSPGSYRINIRGSSLRSPFGVRNVKVYWNGIPLTDAGGNTYFNQLAQNNFSYIEISKGPASSMYGAGTGGLILVQDLDPWKAGLDLGYVTGSFNLHNLAASANFGKKENRNKISFAHQQADGYRRQSHFRRTNGSWLSHIKLSPRQELQASFLFADLEYGTPGALNLSEFSANPRAARPAAGGFPSAEAAKASIFQKNMLAGLTSIYRLHPGWTNTTTLFGMFNQVHNPAIRNYERRKEPGFGARTFFVYAKNDSLQRSRQWKFVAGAEYNEGHFNIMVFDNRNGEADTLRTNDDIIYQQFTAFLQGEYMIPGKWRLTGGLSTNSSRVEIVRWSVLPVSEQVRRFRNEITPRLEIKHLFNQDHSLALIISRGFSPPTLPEILPSTSIINRSLEAEQGWNYELAGNARLFKNKVSLGLNLYYFRLDNAIVQRRDLSGADHFVNAGHTNQKGLEISASYLDFSNGFMETFYVSTQFGYQHYRYGSFARDNEDYSGKRIPSVPAITFSLLATLQFTGGFYLEPVYQAVSRIYFNDANSASAPSYHLISGRLGWRSPPGKSGRWNLFAGADNLLDEVYSLGNDINAPAGRYYNAAAARNFFAGLLWHWRGKK